MKETAKQKKHTAQFDPSYLNHNYIGAELHWQTARFGPYDQDVNFPKKDEIDSAVPFSSVDYFPKNSIGKRKDIARIIKIITHGIEMASYFQSRLDSTDKGYFTHKWTEDDGTQHSEMIGQGHIDRMVFLINHSINVINQQGQTEKLNRNLVKFGIQIDPSGKEVVLWEKKDL